MAKVCQDILRIVKGRVVESSPFSGNTESIHSHDAMLHLGSQRSGHGPWATQRLTHHSCLVESVVTVTPSNSSVGPLGHLPMPPVNRKLILLTERLQRLKLYNYITIYLDINKDTYM